MTINHLEIVQFYILSHTVIPKSYFSGAAKRSARQERAKQIAKLMSKMSAFLKPADRASPSRTTELESNPAFISADSLTFQI